jgi:hypothetical protein
MDYECGKTGCIGGGSFAPLFVYLIFAVWLLLSGLIIFESGVTWREYIKSIPTRIRWFSAVSVIAFGLGWVSRWISS